jgi:cytochrome b involved in lipid metabolism
MKYFYMLALILSILFIVGCSSNAPAANTNNPSNTAVNTPLDNTTVAPNDLPPVPSVPGQVQQVKISSSELALHNTESDCWVAYEGNVYDVTSFLPVHPGGSAKIAQYCGTSGAFENAFTQKHGTSKVSVLEKQGVFKGVLG